MPPTITNDTFMVFLDKDNNKKLHPVSDIGVQCSETEVDNQSSVILELASPDCIILCYDSAGQYTVPETFTYSTDGTVNLGFTGPFSGKIQVIQKND